MVEIGSLIARPQHVYDFLKDLLLDLRIPRQVVECEGDSRRSGVMSLKHKSVHFLPYISIAQWLTIRRGGAQEDVQEIQLSIPFSGLF